MRKLNVNGCGLRTASRDRDQSRGASSPNDRFLFLFSFCMVIPFFSSGKARLFETSPVPLEAWGVWRTVDSGNLISGILQRPFLGGTSLCHSIFAKVYELT